MNALIYEHTILKTQTSYTQGKFPGLRLKSVSLFLFKYENIKLMNPQTTSRRAQMSAL